MMTIFPPHKLMKDLLGQQPTQGHIHAIASIQRDIQEAVLGIKWVPRTVKITNEVNYNNNKKYLYMILRMHLGKLTGEIGVNFLNFQNLCQIQSLYIHLILHVNWNKFLLVSTVKWIISQLFSSEESSGQFIILLQLWAMLMQKASLQVNWLFRQVVRMMEVV